MVRICTASTISVPTEIAPMITTVAPDCSRPWADRVFQRRLDRVLWINEIKRHHK